MDVLQAYTGQLLQGALMTVQLACAALVCGLVLGLVLAACQLSRHGWLRRPVAVLTGVLRGVPEFLVVLVCYFGLSNLINNHFDSAFDISPFFAGVVSLALVLGAYASEVFRGSFVALERGQLEAARSLGLNPVQTFFWCACHRLGASPFPVWATSGNPCSKTPRWCRWWVWKTC